MRVGWPAVVLAIGLGWGLPGCQHAKDRKLRQAMAEEYELPSKDDRRFSDPPTYAEQKRTLAAPKSGSPAPAMPGPSMGGPGMGGSPGGMSPGGSNGFGGRGY